MKSPKAPSVAKMAAAQSGADISTATANAALNNVSQYTPYGNLVYEQAGSYSYYDPVSKKTISVPTWKATQTLSPEQQILLNQEQEFDQKYNQIALNQTDKIGGLLSTPFEYNPGVHEDWAGAAYDKLNGEENARQMAALETQLANKGITIGSEAYDREMSRLRQDQDMARQRFMLDSYNTGFNTALTQRNQPINETSALVNGQQIQNPSFVNTPQYNWSSPNVAGMMQANYQNQSNNYNAMLGGLAGLGGAVLGGWAGGMR